MHILIEGQKTLIGQIIKPVLKLFGLTVSKVKNEPRPSAFISIDKEILQVSRKRWKFEKKNYSCMTKSSSSVDLVVGLF